MVGSGRIPAPALVLHVLLHVIASWVPGPWGAALQELPALALSLVGNEVLGCWGFSHTLPDLAVRLLCALSFQLEGSRLCRSLSPVSSTLVWSLPAGCSRGWGVGGHSITPRTPSLQCVPCVRLQTAFPLLAVARVSSPGDASRQSHASGIPGQQVGPAWRNLSRAGAGSIPASSLRCCLSCPSLPPVLKCSHS